MADRNIPDSWFRASGHHTTMAFITAKHQGRSTPLQDGERQLGWFVLPPFQRPPVWTLEQKVRFIESCWLGLPIGVFIYNRTQEDGPYDSWLLDGQQRVTAVLEYIADAFPVFGHHFSELTKTDYRKWSMSVAFPCMMTNLDNEEMLREVYDRLAYGGTAHDPASRIEARSDATGTGAAEGESLIGEAETPKTHHSHAEAKQPALSTGSTPAHPSEGVGPASIEGQGK